MNHFEVFISCFIIIRKYSIIILDHFWLRLFRQYFFCNFIKIKLKILLKSLDHSIFFNKNRSFHSITRSPIFSWNYVVGVTQSLQSRDRSIFVKTPHSFIYLLNGSKDQNLGQPFLEGPQESIVQGQIQGIPINLNYRQRITKIRGRIILWTEKILWE